MIVLDLITTMLFLKIIIPLALISEGNTWIPFLGNINAGNDKNSIGSGVLVYDGDSFKDFPGLAKIYM